MSRFVSVFMLVLGAYTHQFSRQQKSASRPVPCYCSECNGKLVPHYTMRNHAMRDRSTRSSRNTQEAILSHIRTPSPTPQSSRQGLNPRHATADAGRIQRQPSEPQHIVPVSPHPQSSPNPARVGISRTVCLPSLQRPFKTYSAHSRGYSSPMLQAQACVPQHLERVYLRIQTLHSHPHPHAMARYPHACTIPPLVTCPRNVPRSVCCTHQHLRRPPIVALQHLAVPFLMTPHTAYYLLNIDPRHR